MDVHASPGTAAMSAITLSPSGREEALATLRAPFSPMTSDSESDAAEFYDVASTAGGVSSSAEVAVSSLLGSALQPGTGYAGLPGEILRQIFGYVLVSQRDLQACLLVCRRWCVSGIQVLWFRPTFSRLSTLFQLIHVMVQPAPMFPYASYIRRLNFTLVARDVDDQLFGRMAACHRLERLTLAGCTRITDATLARVLRETPQLVALDVSGVTSVTDATLEVLAHHCPRLQGVNLSGCERITSAGVQELARHARGLRRIKLAQCALVDSDAVLALWTHCPMLLELDVVQCPLLEDRGVAALWSRPSVLREAKLAHCMRLTDGAFPLGDPPASLTRLAWDTMRVLDLTACALVTDDTVRVVAEAMPRLRHLSLAKCTRLSDQSAYAIASLGRSLQHLHLAHIAALTDRAVVHLARHCTRLRYLDLACCTQLTDESVFALAAHLPKLKRIGLVRVAALTDRAIYALVERYTCLERVHLSYCDHITVPAIFWLTLRLERLTHLSLTGVPAFRRDALRTMSRAPPSEFTAHQRQSFCVYSGCGVDHLRRMLQHWYATTEPENDALGALPANVRRAFLEGRQRAGRAAYPPLGAIGADAA